MERRLVEAADAAGAATILTGAGAEGVAEGVPYGLADRLRKLRWWSAVAEARRWARANNESARGILWRYGIQPLLPGWLREGLGTLCRGGRARWPHIGTSSVPPWITPGFSRTHGLWPKGRAAVRHLFAAPYEQTADHFLAHSASGEWATWHLAGPRGVHTAQPFIDPRLIAFCLSLPSSLRLTPGVSKPLLRSAMRGILPEPIRTRRLKGNFNDVYRLGLSRRLGQLEEMIRRSPIAQADILDGDMLCLALHQVAAGVGDLTAGARLNSALSLVAWCDHLGPALRRPVDQPSEVLSLGRVLARAGAGW
jgi:asparagine synthase (glutamine-hydrolysing)